MQIKTLSVTEINNYLKNLIDSDFILNNLCIRGEISNLKKHWSGHIYFSLKDENSKVNCIMFKSDAVNLSHDLENGMTVITKCRLSVYTRDGNYQLYCREITPDGLGDLHVQYEALKKELEMEGLFDQSFKKEIPTVSKKVGVVTSKTGAAFKDIKNVIRRRNSSTEVILYPAKVSGEGAYKTIIEGIEYFNKRDDIDVIIIGRGGGSIEDLWAFNSKSLAYAIFKSTIPIVSAVGHEIDFTISDFVSDYRAATPSVAAEIVAFNSDFLNKTLNNSFKTLNNILYSRLNENKSMLDRHKKIIELNSPTRIISNEIMKISNFKEKLDSLLKSKISNEKIKLLNSNELLDAHNPLNILKKGYTVVLHNKKAIKSVSEISPLKNYDVVFNDGKLKCRFISEKRGE